MTAVSVKCAWCGEPNPVPRRPDPGYRVTCVECWHHANAPRERCGCPDYVKGGDADETKEMEVKPYEERP